MVFLLCIEPGVWRVFANVPEPLARLPRGTKVGAIHWQSSFHISDRVAAQEAFGRVVLAGDAAHLHAPVAARGINLGIEDAFAFAHCAADALRGDLKRLSEYGLLRHDVHARVVAGVRQADALGARSASSPRPLAPVCHASHHHVWADTSLHDRTRDRARSPNQGRSFLSRWAD